MDSNERQIIDDLFTRLRQAEGQSGARDTEAEARIAQHVSDQPAASYYMAQAIVVQQDALAKAQTRIDALEQQLAEQPAGGFLSGLFGGVQKPPMAPARGGAGQVRGDHRQGGAGGFLGGAMQTALGVAGGFLIADALTGLLAPDEAAAAEAEPWSDALPEGEERLPSDDPDMGGEGDFDVGGFDDF